MTLTIELTPEEEARLRSLATCQGKPLEECLREIIAQAPMPPGAATRALFAQWEAEAARTPEEIAEAEAEWEEFKANVNANHGSDRVVYP